MLSLKGASGQQFMAKQEVIKRKMNWSLDQQKKKEERLAELMRELHLLTKINHQNQEPGDKYVQNAK